MRSLQWPPSRSYDGTKEYCRGHCVAQVPLSHLLLIDLEVANRRLVEGWSGCQRRRIGLYVDCGNDTVRRSCVLVARLCEASGRRLDR